MKILFTSKGESWDSKMDPRFGRTEYFFVYDEDSEKVEVYDNRSIADQAHGAGPKTAQKMAEYGMDAIITGNGPGGNAASVIEKTGVEIYTGAGSMTVREAYRSYRNDELDRF